MVAAVAPKSRADVALYLLIIVVTRNYGYLLFEPEQIGAVSKALGGAAMLAVVPLLYRAAPTRLVALVLAYWSFEALQTVLCSVAYAIEPWSVPTGVSICSAGLGFDFGAVGIMLAAVLLYFVVRRQAVNLDGYENKKDGP